ncbi:MAG: VCBS repeat-containing protein [Candidatus Marinimicrobia bacterium]|nr:VCBS repeat-containing protein [Candidatus Neomarinimicrobiota bacterium]
MKRILTLISLLCTLLVSSGFAQLTFTDNTAAAGVENIEGVAKGIAFGDIDNDGDLDIYVSNFGQSNV